MRSLGFFCTETTFFRQRLVVRRLVARGALRRGVRLHWLGKRAVSKRRWRMETFSGIVSITRRPTRSLGASVKTSARKPSPRAAQRLQLRQPHRRRLHKNNVKRMPIVGGKNLRPRATKAVSTRLRRAATTSPASKTIPPSAPT
jgi:hypothetical protein